MRRLMKNLTQKLHRQNGETLPEVLASILICTLSVALLFTGIMASVKINEQAAKSDEGFYDALSIAEQKTGTPLEKNQIMVEEVKNGAATGKTVIFNIEYYGSDKLKSYKAKGVVSNTGGLMP